jgi:uncharacterized protein
MRKSSTTLTNVKNNAKPRAGRLRGMLAALALACAASGSFAAPGCDSACAVRDSIYESVKRSESAFYQQTNPLSMLLVGLINIYQRVFSSQEGTATCQFRPSCSHFGALSIKKYGPLQGVLMTGDRMLRCNPWTEDAYPPWKDNYHKFDPVEEHSLWSSDTP